MYVKEVFIRELVKLPSFKQKDYKKALEESFVKFDELLRTPEGLREIKNYSA